MAHDSREEKVYESGTVNRRHTKRIAELVSI